MLSHSPEETRAFGEKLAAELLPGDTVLLFGDLGAGKSELTRGIARGLGIMGPVPSPSFTILNVYGEGRFPLYHFDWYRLCDASELFELGMEEYLGGDGVAVVEWPERCTEAWPESFLAVRIQPQDPETRLISLESSGGFHPDAELYAD